MNRYAVLDEVASLFAANPDLSADDALALYLRCLAGVDSRAIAARALRRAWDDPAFAWTDFLAEHDLGDYPDAAAAKARARTLFIDPLTPLMVFDGVLVNREQRYSLDRERYFGRVCLAFPVRNEFCEYIEYYEIDEAQFALFQRSETAALAFADACRARQMDHLLIILPGRLRGSAC